MYASLLISLLAAFVAMLGKQWLNRYLRHAGGSMIERCGDRQCKFDGLKEWPFQLFVESLPVMLQASLLLLTSGLCRHMWSINAPVAYVLITLIALGVLFYFGIVIAGTSSYECPFQTPASATLRGLWKKVQPHTIHVFQVLSSNIFHPLWKKVAHLVTSTILYFQQVTLKAVLNFGQWIRPQPYIHHPSPGISLEDVQEIPHTSPELGAPTLIRTRGTNRIWGITSPTPDTNPPHHSSNPSYHNSNTPYHNPNPSYNSSNFSHHSSIPPHHSSIPPHHNSSALHYSPNSSHHSSNSSHWEASAPTHTKRNIGLQLTWQDPIDTQNTNTKDVRCVSWILRNITDPEALDAAVRFAGMIQWFEDGIDIEPPYDTIVSIFHACLDHTGTVYPGLLDRAYHSAWAILWIHICAMSKSEECAHDFPLPHTRNTISDNPDLCLLLEMYKAIEFPVTLAYETIFTEHNTPTHMQWASQALLHFCRTKQEDPRAFSVCESEKIPDVPWKTIPLDAVLNLLCVWSIFLNSPVEEVLKIQDEK